MSFPDVFDVKDCCLWFQCVRNLKHTLRRMTLSGERPSYTRICSQTRGPTVHRQACQLSLRSPVSYIKNQKIETPKIELPHDKTNKMTCAPSKDSDQTGHPPSLIRVFAVHMKNHWVLSYPLSAQRRLIRLGGCPGWSESSLGSQIILLVLSWGVSNISVIILNKQCGFTAVIVPYVCPKMSPCTSI